MVKNGFPKTFRKLATSKKYVLYSSLYGVTTLIVPLAVQYLVNNLALAGMWINIVGFLVIIIAGLILSLILRYCQIILNEFLQRELFMAEIKDWNPKILQKYKIYFVEVFFGMKSYSKSFTGLVEIALVTVFGLVMLILFHPFFLLLTLLIAFALYQINESTKPAVESSIHVSDQKYKLLNKAIDDNSSEHSEQELAHYLRARSERFYYIKKNTIKVSLVYIICQIALLGGGAYLVQSNQLSIGQLVSAEIILSNILISLSKLPDILEGMYDFETSLYKLNKAKKAVNG
jgi:ABC-type bacteriocin/lantibiotic exporter with double-glycine peptidase domain